MISEELLSAVLKVTAVNVKQHLLDKKSICYEQKSFPHGFTAISIYELAYECKEWAITQGYLVGTDLDRVNVYELKSRRIVNYFEVYPSDYLEFEIKACEWILESIK